MGDSERIFDESLLDYELGRLEGPERAAVERALSASPKLREQQALLREAFGGLGQWSEPAAPSYLVSQVMAGVASVERAGSTAGEASSSLPPSADGTMTSSPILTIRELVAIAACITVFVGILVPAGVKARRMAWRAQCENNMKLVMGGLATYAQGFEDNLPFVGSMAGASWRRSRPGVPRTSNTRHAYLLVKTRHVASPKVFVCPAQSEARVMSADDYTRFNDFAERANFTYSYQNMGGSTRPKWRANPRMVVMADANPLFGHAAVHRLGAYDTDVNSASHFNEDGQNVGRLDGSVDWARTAKAGVDGDNIWTPAGGRPEPERLGFAVPASATDSFLLNAE